MPSNEWLVNISKQEVTHFTKTDRPDGYDFSLELRLERTNNTSMQIGAKGAVNELPNGQQWTLDLDIQGAAILSPAQLPSHIETRIAYGDVINDERANHVEMTTTYGSGRSETTKEVRIMPVATPKLDVEQYLQRFAQMFSGKPFDKAFLDEDPSVDK